MAPLVRFLPVFLACILAGMLAIMAKTTIAVSVISISTKVARSVKCLVLLGAALGRCFTSVSGWNPLDVTAVLDVRVTG